MDSLRRCLLLLVALLSLVSCSQRAGTVEQYVDYLYQSMNLADDVAKPRAYWEANVAKTLEVRDRMQWGVPEREFRYFVLPIRVGMEALDDFRTLYLVKNVNDIKDAADNDVVYSSLEASYLEKNRDRLDDVADATDSRGGRALQ